MVRFPFPEYQVVIDMDLLLYSRIISNLLSTFSAFYIHKTIRFDLVTNLWDYVIHETDTDDIKLDIKPFVSMI